MYVNHGLSVVALLVLYFCSCFPVDPRPERLSGSPELTCGGMVPVADPVDGYRESIQLSWTFDTDEDQALHSFTLLRKLAGDSVFDVFPRSREIPVDTSHFFDELENQVFPRSGIDSVKYRILAVDSFGRTSDTSSVCTFLLAPRPVFTSFDASARCLAWESWIRGGSTSWCVVWSDDADRSWTSPRRDEFPFTDEPARFSACLPDSLGMLREERWYYALYLRANEAYSLTIGELDAP